MTRGALTKFSPEMLAHPRLPIFLDSRTKTPTLPYQKVSCKGRSFRPGPGSMLSERVIATWVCLFGGCPFGFPLNYQTRDTKWGTQMKSCKLVPEQSKNGKRGWPPVQKNKLFPRASKKDPHGSGSGSRGVRLGSFTGLGRGVCHGRARVRTLGSPKNSPSLGPPKNWTHPRMVCACFWRATLLEVSFEGAQRFFSFIFCVFVCV